MYITPYRPPLLGATSAYEKTTSKRPRKFTKPKQAYDKHKHMKLESYVYTYLNEKTLKKG